MSDDLGALLVRRGVVEQSELDSAISYRRRYGGSIPEVLVKESGIPEDYLAGAIAELTDHPRVQLDEIEPEESALRVMDQATAEADLVFPIALREQGSVLRLAVTDPTDLPVLRHFAQETGRRIDPLVAGPTEILLAISKHYPHLPPAPVYDEQEDLGEELFDIRTFSPSEVAKIQKIVSHQEKGSLVLRAVIELLVEKGVVSPDELRRRQE